MVNVQRFLCLAGCLESLKALLKDNNDMVRIKTTEVLYIMATHNVGRWAAVSGNQCHALEPHHSPGWHALG